MPRYNPYRDQVIDGQMCIWLQYYGWHPAIQAQDFQPGDKIVYNTGTYKPTPAFNSAPEHIAVCFDDDSTLVAVTGYADDPENVAESIAYARLFAAAPELLDLLEKITTLTDNEVMDKSNALRKIIPAARKAIQKARGES